jgi:hypothetical protein
VNGLEAIGNSPLKRLPAGGAATLNFENADAAATDPSVFNRVRRSISKISVRIISLAQVVYFDTRRQFQVSNKLRIDIRVPIIGTALWVRTSCGVLVSY